MGVFGFKLTAWRFMGLSAATAVLVAACGGSGGTPTSVTPTVGPTTGAGATTASSGLTIATGSAGGSPAPSAGETPEASNDGSTLTVNLAAGSAGSYLTGDAGKALYFYKKDSQSDSACTSSKCTSSWPPLTLSKGHKATAGDGVTGTIATFARADGKKQVTINGQPLYYFAGDNASGDTNGVGVSPDWSLAIPKSKGRPGY
jgi:predicted lipoprotein with Yx(FWY)xxD motif